MGSVMGRKSRARSKAGLPGALDETDALPDEYNPDVAYAGGTYDVEAGYAPGQSNQAAPARGAKPEQAYKVANNQRNESWSGEERDPQFRAMDLMGSKAMAARGRGALMDEEEEVGSSKWQAAKKAARKKELKEQKERRESQKETADTWEQREIVKLKRKNILDHVMAIVYFCFAVATVVVSLTQRGKNCNSVLNLLMLILGGTMLLQVVFRVLAMYPHLACEAEEFPDTRIMMLVWIASRVCEVGLWGAVTLLPLLEAVCNDHMVAMSTALGIACPALYSSLYLITHAIQSGGVGF